MEPYYQWSFFFRLPADILARIMTYYEQVVHSFISYNPNGFIGWGFYTKQYYSQQFIIQSINGGTFASSGAPHIVKSLYPFVNLCIDRIEWKKGRYVAREQHRTGWRRIRG